MTTTTPVAAPGITAAELRIGNMISEAREYWSETEYTWRPITVTLDNIASVCNNKLYAPIPLTPEILEKAGFVKTSDDLVDTYTHNIKEHIVITGADDFFSIRLHSPNKMKGYNMCLSTVHQLQNLFFALTFTELTITL